MAMSHHPETEAEEDALKPFDQHAGGLRAAGFECFDQGAAVQRLIRPGWPGRRCCVVHQCIPASEGLRFSDSSAGPKYSREVLVAWLVEQTWLPPKGGRAWRHGRPSATSGARRFGPVQWRSDGIDSGTEPGRQFGQFFGGRFLEGPTSTRQAGFHADRDFVKFG